MPCLALRLFHAEQTIDAAAVLAELLAGLDVERAWMRQVDAEIVVLTAGPARMADNACSKKNRFADAVRHEDDGLFCLAPDAKQLEINLFACQRIQRAERLIHQDQLGIVD